MALAAGYRIQHERAAIKIRLYRNGDETFFGKDMVINRRQIRNFDSFLNVASQHVQMPEQVRVIKTPQGRHAVDSLDQLVDKQEYVAVGRGRFRRLGYQTLKQRSQEKQRLLRRKREANLRLPQDVNTLSSGGPSTEKITKEVLAISVFVNGSEYEAAKRIILPPRILSSWIYVYSEIGAHLNCHFGAVYRLYTLSGHRIAHIEQLRSGEQYVALGRYGQFIRCDYGSKHKDFVISSKLPPKPYETLAQSESGEVTGKYGGRSREDLRVSRQRLNEDAYHTSAGDITIRRTDGEKVLPRRPKKHRRRRRKKFSQVNYDQDEGGVFKAKTSHAETEGAAEVGDNVVQSESIDFTEAQQIDENQEVDVSESGQAPDNNSAENNDESQGRNTRNSSPRLSPIKSENENRHSSSRRSTRSKLSQKSQQSRRNAPSKNDSPSHISESHQETASNAEEAGTGSENKQVNRVNERNLSEATGSPSLLPNPDQPEDDEAIRASTSPTKSQAFDQFEQDKVVVTPEHTEVPTLNKSIVSETPGQENRMRSPDVRNRTLTPAFNRTPTPPVKSRASTENQALAGPEGSSDDQRPAFRNSRNSRNNSAASDHAVEGNNEKLSQNREVLEDGGSSKGNTEEELFQTNYKTPENVLEDNTERKEASGEGEHRSRSASYTYRMEESKEKLERGKSAENNKNLNDFVFGNGKRSPAPKDEFSANQNEVDEKYEEQAKKDEAARIIQASYRKRYKDLKKAKDFSESPSMADREDSSPFEITKSASYSRHNHANTLNDSKNRKRDASDSSRKSKDTLDGVPNGARILPANARSRY